MDLSLRSKKDKKNAKEKKKKLPLKRSISNICFAFGEVWRSSHSYFLFYFTITIAYALLDFFSESYLIRMIVNGVESKTPTEKIIAYMIVMAVLSLSINIINSLYWNIFAPAQSRKIGATMQKKIFKKASEVELACYEKPSFFDKYVRAMDEAYGRVMQVMSTMDNLIWRVISLVCNSFLLFLIDPLLIVFGLIPLFLGSLRRYHNKLKHDQVVDKKPVDRRIKYIRRTFYMNEYAKEMRIGGMYRLMLDEIQNTYKDLKVIYKRYGLKRVFTAFALDMGLEVVTILGAMFYAVWRTMVSGTMSMGDCIVILSSIGTISYCLNYLVTSFTEFGEHALFIEDVRYFLDYQPSMVEDENAPLAHGGDIELDNVSFRYEGAESDTLHNISLKIKHGERIALVGQNGSGKTTLVKLLLRLYDPTDGKVMLDGIDAKDYRLSSYRDTFSCVFQDFQVFSMSVKENVVLRATREGDDALVTEALKESGAYERIMKLEGGIDTTLTREFDENGVNLSVGEAQKVSLARVFAEDSPCVILDEPSSALDPIAEHKMFENMMRAAEGRSVIFISHRLSSAVDADRIYLLEDGRITEVGTHHELMELGGRYAEMFHLQAENYLGKEEAV